MSKKDYSKYSKEELIKLIKGLEKQRYGLVWEDKPEEVADRCSTELPVLVEDKSKEIITDKNLPTNILIEGDNYHALYTLNFTHKKKIDLIIIDPPYNIGGDFMYNDKIVDKEDRYRHSKWLSFMKKRLQLARNLLKDTGAIFITIDDAEAAHLKVLCDEIFLPQNFIAQICWQKKFSPQNDATYFSDMHDFVLVYAKKAKTKKTDKGGFNLFGLERTEEMNDRYSNPDNDPRGDWTSGDFSVKTYSEEYDYSITTPSGRFVHPPAGYSWRTSFQRLQEMIADNRIWFGEHGNNVPRIKRFLSEVKEDVTPTTWWTHEKVGHNQEAKQELKQILPDAEAVFDTPKPVRLIKRILELATSPDKPSVVLDFFAGSGTTAHAVLEQNDKDGGKRQFILVTNNESQIASNICYPRIKRAIGGYDYQGNLDTLLFEEKLTLAKLKKCEKIYSKYQEIRQLNADKYDELKGELKNNMVKLWGAKKNLTHSPGLGGNLKYFKTDFVPQVLTDNDKRVLVARSTELLCLAEGTFDPVRQNKKDFAIFENAHQYTAIIYDEDAITKCKKAMQKLDGSKPISIYVFSYDYTYYEDDFEDISNVVKIKPIPEAILNVYRKIAKYKKR
ncbi:MAG: site-specific DNA-methyltransferase [Nitrospirae bacterium]|nr:MAG: site-specific DNA-methyltransferase [Nitrospirota bacterium]